MTREKTIQEMIEELEIKLLTNEVEKLKILREQIKRRKK